MVHGGINILVKVCCRSDYLGSGSFYEESLH